MSYVSPAIKDKFETLSVDLKNDILERNVQLNSIHDLIDVLDQIVKESEHGKRQNKGALPILPARLKWNDA